MRGVHGVAVGLAFTVVACTLHDAPRAEARLAAELERVRAAMGEPHPTGSRSLRYRVRSGGKAWTWEIAVTRSQYAERRTRPDGSAYTIGIGARSPWLRTAARPAVEVDGDFGAEARTRHALFSARFARPGARDSAEMLPAGRDAWELSFRPEGGRTLGLRIDRATALPTAFDWVDDYNRIQRCEELEWIRRGEGGLILGHARCEGIIHDAGRHTTTLDLEAAEWARPEWADADPIPLRKTWDTVAVPIEAPHQVIVPVEIGGKVLRMVLDSGAAVTTLSERAAREVGAVPTGEPPIHFKPPWLPEQIDWMGVVDRIDIGQMSVHGARVTVMSEGGLGGFDGLLGFDFFRHAVVDVDSPAKTLRLWSRDRYARPSAATALQVWGTSHSVWSIDGEVARVDDGKLLLDTGAALDVVVHHPLMAVRYPRRRGDDMNLGAFEQEVSPDYVTEIDGMKLGPFDFPRMPAFGRDRERKRIGEGFLGLVGMGLLRHFRVGFDAHKAQVHLSPGHSYTALVKLGIEIEDRDGRAVVTRIVPGGRAGSLRHLRELDTIVSVDGRPTSGAAAAVAAIASADAPTMRLGWEAHGARRSAVLSMR